MTSLLDKHIGKVQTDLLRRIEQAFLTWLGATDAEDAFRIIADLAELGIRPVIEYGKPGLTDLHPRLHRSSRLAIEQTVSFRYVPIEPTA